MEKARNGRKPNESERGAIQLSMFREMGRTKESHVFRAQERVPISKNWRPARKRTREKISMITRRRSGRSGNVKGGRVALTPPQKEIQKVVPFSKFRSGRKKPVEGKGGGGNAPVGKKTEVQGNTGHKASTWFWIKTPVRPVEHRIGQRSEGCRPSGRQLTLWNIHCQSREEKGSKRTDAGMSTGRGKN